MAGDFDSEALARRLEDIEACFERKNIEKGVILLEETLGTLRPEDLSPDTEPVISRLFQHLLIGYNSLGMQQLRAGATERALQLLNSADALTAPSNVFLAPVHRQILKCITFNNLGCAYKSQGRTHTALQFLKEALRREAALQTSGSLPPSQSASTHLNICTVLSEMSRHHDAVHHAMRAVNLLQMAIKEGIDEFRESVSGAVPLNLPQGAIVSPSRRGSSGSSALPPPLLPVAYFNCAVQYEHMQQFEQAIKYYEKALELCRLEESASKGQQKEQSSSGGQQHPLVPTIRTSIAEVRRAMVVLEEKIRSRRSSGASQSDGFAHTGRERGAGVKTGTRAHRQMRAASAQ
ncbi:unnamed protein product [Vitrella brassicaformis CCMP3155]|uniref:MalT-like TPR region domain-containing protein n=1 Tax=Vitrella brassicaformis (strain CCMP3155) TaxID=1169540 RepID=A0A0G4EEG4_VITBC|nr:unnamed protein product [Vitrella brassicaformis CCMP3155]|eukprot:CEL93759.1 unnamed protein product [Vitrella brassicaformis CCMP3155]